jgi:hypothetical protein
MAGDSLLEIKSAIKALKLDRRSDYDTSTVNAGEHIEYPN